MIGVVEGVVLYLAVVGVHLPWLVLLVRKKWLFRFPLVSFCFLGLFSQNVVGSILVIFPDVVGRVDYFSYEFVWMLVVQIILFYIVTTPYLLQENRPFRTFLVSPRRDYLTIAALSAVSLLIIWLYIARYGMPPIMMIVTNQLAGLELIKYRVELTYGIEDYSLYHVGISIVPIIVALMALFLFVSRRDKSPLLMVLIAVAATAIPAGKGSVVDAAICLTIAYAFYYRGYTGVPERKIPYGKLTMWWAAAFGVIFLMYGVYYETDSVASKLLRLVYRSVGINSESMAAAVMYTREFRFLEGSTLPTIRGLLDHDVINVARELHSFMFGPGGGAPVSAPVEGYINFGWIGFVVMALIAFSFVVWAEYVFRRLPRNLLVLAVLVLCVLFAFKISHLSLTATFASLTYACLFIALGAIRASISLVVRSLPESRHRTLTPSKS